MILITTLLSLIPLSCIVASKIEVVYIFSSTYYSIISFSMNPNCISEDIDIDAPRSRSDLLSPNSKCVLCPIYR